MQKSKVILSKQKRIRCTVIRLISCKTKQIKKNSVTTSTAKNSYLCSLSKKKTQSHSRSAQEHLKKGLFFYEMRVSRDVLFTISTTLYLTSVELKLRSKLFFKLIFVLTRLQTLGAFWKWVIIKKLVISVMLDFSHFLLEYLLTEWKI